MAPKRPLPRLDREPISPTKWQSMTGCRKWACIVNTAAYTVVDAADNNAAAAWRANARFPAFLATAGANKEGGTGSGHEIRRWLLQRSCWQTVSMR